MSFITEKAWKQSHLLAQERGPFPLFNKSRLNQDFPVRNSCVTSIAPTGTISIISGCAGGGIEPFPALVYHKNVLNGKRLEEVNPYLLGILNKRNIFLSDSEWKKIKYAGSIQEIGSIPEDIKDLFKTANEIPVERHIEMMAVFQKHTTNSISKTINLPNNASVEDVEKAYWLAYESGVKSVTIYRDGSKSKQVLETLSTEATKQKISKNGHTQVSKFIRPEKLNGQTVKAVTEFGNLYMTLNCDEHGKLREVFASLGKAGSTVHADLEGLCRTISLALQYGVPAEEIGKQLKNIKGGNPVIDNGSFIYSVSDAIGKVILTHLNIDAKSIVHDFAEACPDCHSKLIMAEGCQSCKSCGFSRC